MQISISAAFPSLAALSPLVSAIAVQVREPQNQNRPVPTGDCCVANTSLKQDTCTAASGATGRCVPGGNDCGGSLSCVEESGLECDDSVIERGNSLCRAIAGNGGLFDGANIIQSLADATVN
ncbi:uncharacterized protein HMPREF1541_05308 [Cyphellophora europaea CBS 101466]|uniref:Uncharacterized protein n=1 Tax=Cyphellophora europaea (strain CBS 101466) TaxID=1220924 RepID=W2RRE0_CYPE1|nr:uncharacterized protein HMPREF1541_05308 [Cyphellophora europaea CBS 101466]ETN39086.1 hypothetical protein HMPREF1541_05308 [Cyphellophora europaea CBS 101466]